MSMYVHHALGMRRYPRRRILHYAGYPASTLSGSGGVASVRYPWTPDIRHPADIRYPAPKSVWKMAEYPARGGYPATT